MVREEKGVEDERKEEVDGSRTGVKGEGKGSGTDEGSKKKKKEEAN